MKHIPAALAPLSLAVSLALLAGCAVGPNYHGAPDIGADMQTFARAGDTGVSANPAPSQWWLALGDTHLDALIEDALTHNPDLHAAQARLRQARAQFGEQRAAGLPSADVNAAAIYMDGPDTTKVTYYANGFDASWELDLFGGTRRAVEAASAQTEAVQADLADTQVSIAAEVASAYIDVRDLQQRMALIRQTLDMQQNMLALTQQQRERGVADDSDVERLATQVETTRASLSPLSSQLTDALDSLAVLTGHTPGALDVQLSRPGSLPAVPETVAISDPATLLRQRPDIRAAERRLAKSNAQIGQHVADYFPKITLLGNIGFAGTSANDLYNTSNLSWIGVPILQWNLFNFGKTRNQVHEAEAARDEAEAKYTKTVLAALQDANGALSRYGHQRERVVMLDKVSASATHAADLMQQRNRAGVVSMIDLLDTQRQALSAQADVISGRAELLKDYVSLQKSLGMGWQDAPVL